MDHIIGSIFLLFVLNIYFNALTFATNVDVEAELKTLALERTDIPNYRIHRILQDIKKEPTHKNLIINEMSLRKLFSLKREDPCDAVHHYGPPSLLKPPEKPKEYITWQNHFTSSNKPLCDPLKNLICRGNKCRCSFGLADSSPNCDLTANSVCGESYNRTLLFDPLTPTYYPDSINKATTPIKFTNQPKCPPSSQCLKLDYFTRSFCLPLESNLKKLSEDIGNLGKLSVGDSCQPNTLYRNPAKYTMDFAGDEAELKKFKNSGIEFCNPRKLLYCGTNSKCVCLEPTVLNPASNECEIPPWKKCNLRGSPEEILEFFSDKDIATIVHHNLASGMKTTKCKANSVCTQASNEPGSEYRVCKCRDGRFGDTCEISLSRSLMNVQETAYPFDVEDFSERLQIFGELNKNVLGVESRMKLPDKQVCDQVQEDKTEEVSLFSVSISSSLPELYRQDKEAYEKTISKASDVITSQKELCDRKLKLGCNSKICGQINIEQRSKDLRTKVDRLPTRHYQETCNQNFTLGGNPTTNEVNAHYQNLLNDPNAMLCDLTAKKLTCVGGVCRCVGQNSIEASGTCISQNELLGVQGNFETDASPSLHIQTKLLVLFLSMFWMELIVISFLVDQ